MTIQTPTRITIEIDADATATPTVRIVPEAGTARPQPVVGAEPREDVPVPAAYQPGPCLCLDDEDCGQDHGND